MSINLFVAGSNVHQNFVNSEKDLKAQATFKKAVVSTGTWILYTYANYNAAQAGGSPSNYKVLRKGNEEDISSVNGSLYLVEDPTEGFILFEHFYYGGFRQVQVVRVKPRLNRKKLSEICYQRWYLFQVTLTLC